jgi:hypothetical protein
METHAEGLGGKLLNLARQTMCGLHGHDSLLQFERDRMFLRCVSCGHETPGWEINDTPPVAAAKPVDVHTTPVLQPQLISARRVA